MVNHSGVGEYPQNYECVGRCPIWVSHAEGSAAQAVVGVPWAGEPKTRKCICKIFGQLSTTLYKELHPTVIKDVAFDGLGKAQTCSILTAKLASMHVRIRLTTNNHVFVVATSCVENVAQVLGW